MYRSHRQRVVAALVSMGMAALLAACGSGMEQRPSSERAEAPRSERVAQPYDIFLGERLGAINYGVLQVRDVCLVKRGYTYTRQQAVGRRPTNPFEGLQVSAASFGLASEARARSHGFGTDLPAEPPSLISYDVNFDKAVEECWSDAWRQLGTDGKQTYDSYSELGGKLNDALVPVFQVKPPAEVTTTMLDCVTGMGFTVSDRAGWITDYDVRGFGVEFGTWEQPAGGEWRPKEVPGTVAVGPATPAKRYVPTEGEVRLAVAWFQCDTRVGLTKWIFDQAIAAERRAVDRHEAELVELNPRIEELARMAAEMVGR